MSRLLIILGASGNALDILDVAEAINTLKPTWKVAGILDDVRPVDDCFASLGVLGQLSSASQFEGAMFISGIGSDRSFQHRPRVIASTGLPESRFATLIHPLAAVSTRAKIGCGVCINAGSSVAGNVLIGNHVTVGAGAVVGHDSAIGNYTVLAPGSIVSGFCQIEAGCYIGAGAMIRQRVRIESATLVGMGAVVLRDVDNGSVVVGNPAHVMKRPTPQRI